MMTTWKRRAGGHLILLACLPTLTACGSEHDATPGMEPAGSGGQAGMAGHGGGAGGTTSLGGAGMTPMGTSGDGSGKAGADAGGAAGVASSSGGAADQAGQAGQSEGSQAGAPNDSDCVGSFADERVLVPGVKNLVWSSPTLPSGELELFFAQRSATDPGRHVMRTTRPSRDGDFADPTAVSELDSVCSDTEERTVSITTDGLRLYIGCYTGVGSITPGLLHLARRPNRDAPFVVDSQTYGTVGPNIDVTRDELSAFSTSTENVANPPRKYARSALDQPFGEAEPVPGLEAVSLSGPNLAPDGLTLFGALRPDLVVVTRPNVNAPFGAPSVVFSGEDRNVYSSPQISDDCRSLYFLRVEVMSDGLPIYSIHGATR